MHGSYISEAHVAISYYMYLLDLSLVTLQLGCSIIGIHLQCLNDTTYFNGIRHINYSEPAENSLAEEKEGWDYL